MHLIDASNRGVKRVLVATVDTDVAVVLIYHFFFFEFEALWVEMGVGQHRRWLPIHTDAQLLTSEVCQGLLFLYAETGWDTVFMFSGHGKKNNLESVELIPKNKNHICKVPVKNIQNR